MQFLLQTLGNGKNIMWFVPSDVTKPVILNKTPVCVANLLFQSFEKNVPDLKVDQHVCMPMKVMREAGMFEGRA